MNPYILCVSISTIFLFACREELQVYQTRTPIIFAPIQSDSCLLGEKIIGFEDSISKHSAVSVPIWRADNFNTLDSLHISDVERLYSNYHVDFVSANTVIIQTEKLYTHARTFTRLIEFNEDGYQIADTTFYNYTLGELINYEKIKILILEHPKVSTVAHQISWGNYTESIVFLDEKYHLLKAVQEPKRGLETKYFKTNQISHDSIEITFQVIEGCGGCFDDFWKYTIVVNPDGELLDAYVSEDNTSRSYHPPTNEELKLEESEIWN